MKRYYLSIIFLLIFLNIILSVKIKNISNKLGKENELALSKKVAQSFLFTLNSSLYTANGFIPDETNLNILEDYCTSILTKLPIK